MMRYMELVNMLQKKYEIHTLISGNSVKITDIQLLDNNICKWDEHVLYVGKFARLKNSPDRPIMLLCVDDFPPLPEGSNCSRIHNEDLYSLFNMAKDLIFEDLQAEGALFKLAQMAIERKNPAKVINVAASLLGNALILVNTNMKVLIHSTNYEIADPLWAENVERGHYSDEFSQKLRSSMQLKNWSRQGSETQFITLPGDRQRKLVARITREGHLVGALIMIEHHTPIKRSHILQLPLVGEILFETLNSDSYSGEVHETFYSSVLNNLLDELDVSDTLQILSRFRDHFPKVMSVVVARFTHPVENRYLKHLINMELKRIFPVGYSVRHKGYMAILVATISQKEREELAKLARREDVIIGISWPFTDIADFKRHFYQAIASVKYAQYLENTDSVVNYTDISYFDLLQNYKGETPLKHFCHPALKVLRNYDEENNSKLYVTLRTYLECNKNLKSTAEALFIHRNSLIYRIQRIKQLTGLDLNSVTVINSLMDSFRIERFLNTGINEDSMPFQKKQTHL